LLGGSPERRVIHTLSSANRFYDPMQPQQKGGKPLLFRTVADMGKTEQELIAFANRFGLLLQGEENNLGDWLTLIGQLHLQISLFEDDKFRSEDWTEGLYGYEGGIDRSVQMALIKEGNNNKVSLKLRLPSLRAALWTQFGLWVSKPGIDERKCGVCGHWFTYGPGTGKRSTARYCRDKCWNSADYQNRKKPSKTHN
jgi:hypothetical protein